MTHQIKPVNQRLLIRITPITPDNIIVPDAVRPASMDHSVEVLAVADDCKCGARSGDNVIFIANQDKEGNQIPPNLQANTLEHLTFFVHETSIVAIVREPLAEQLAFL